MVKAPAGWVADAERASSLAQTVHGAAEMWSPPGQIGVALVVTRAPAADAKVVIADAHGEVERAKLTSAKVVEDSWQETATGASLAWHDDDAGVRYRSRVVVANGVAVVGECLSRTDSPKDLAAACEGALATLDAGVGAEAPSVPTDVKPTRTSGMSEPGPQIRMPPTTIPQEPTTTTSETDKRPMYLGAGLVILALVFWWNRSRREKFTKEDADASDLHDAAKGEDGKQDD